MTAQSKLEYRFTTRLVGVAGVTRTIAIRATQTLDDLHHAIREAHGWHDEHLYAFWLKGSYWAQDGSEYTHPFHAAVPNPLAAYSDARPVKSADVRLDRLGLERGQKIAYVFDFGDEWRVDLRLSRVAACEGGSYPRIEKSKGQAPPQYPDWDDEEEAEVA